VDILTVIFVGIGLSMDAFAVSVTSGLVIKNERLNSAIKIGFMFGMFQALMPVIGWFTGSILANFIEKFDHWLAFGMLAFIGIKMIYESFHEKDNDRHIESMNFMFFFFLGIATSIDALIVGVSFAFLNVSIIMPVIIIGLITFSFSFVGVYIGNKVGHFFERRVEIIGGLILIGIGVKILLEHLLKP
jgi:manganese efflux pump family protein